MNADHSISVAEQRGQDHAKLPAYCIEKPNAAKETCTTSLYDNTAVTTRAAVRRDRITPQYVPVSSRVEQTWGGGELGLGSNTFDLLVVVPVGVLLAGATVVNFSRAAPMMGSLTFATIIMFILMQLNMELTRRDAIVLLVVYIVFLVWMTFEAFGATSALGMRLVG